MYNLFLALHNIARWVVIILGVVAFGMALAGWLGKRPWTDTMRKLLSYFAISVDIQLLFGLVLYFISPVGAMGLSNMGNSATRFYALEHPTIMLLGLVFAHLASALPKRAAGDKSKYARATLMVAIALLLIIGGVPWERSLLPF